MNVLITGSAGFIGFHLTIALVNHGYEVIGIDNINDYYDVNLKYSRLAECGIRKSDIAWNTEVASDKFPNYHFIKLNLEDKNELIEICKEYDFEIVINLAAQAGVRYSITNPDAYIQSNLVGFHNILEACRQTAVNHLVYASSSSVYGLNEQIPFSIKHNVDHPASLYAATKKANELMAHAYSHLYNIPTTGLRFFTVYGPWSRPDMACFLFAESIINGKPIPVFNKGKMKRDFTYIDDVVTGIMKVLESPYRNTSQWTAKDLTHSASSAPYNIFNIGNNKPVHLMHFIRELETCLGKKAIIEMNCMQPGDIISTWADIDETRLYFNYNPKTTLHSGLQNFSDWYKSYYTSDAMQPVNGYKFSD
jgi:UDP-glucuronate 4-epimerase